MRLKYRRIMVGLEDIKLWRNIMSRWAGIPETRSVLARDSMLSALYAIANPSVCPSVCLSVRHTGGSVKHG